MDPAQLYRDAAEAAYRRLPRSARPAARRLHHRVVPTLGALRRRLHATAAQVRRPAAPSVVSDPRRARRAQCDSPRVTVVMPVRDAAPYVEAAVRSVLEQDLEELELVVVDDGSLDRTTDLVADIAARDGRLRLLRHGEPLGPSAARNDGIAAATAPFLCFLDGDDLMYPSSLRSRWEAAVVAPPGAAGSYCGWESIGPDEVPRSPQRGTPSLPRVSYLQADGECPFIISAPLVRTDVVRAVGGFDEALHAAEDFDLWLRLLREGWWFDPVGVIGVAYRQHGSGIMRTDVIGFVDGVTAVYDSLEKPLDSIRPGAPAPFSRPLSEYRRDVALYRRLVAGAALAHVAGDADALATLLRRVPTDIARAADHDELLDTVRSALGRVLVARPSLGPHLVDDTAAVLWRHLRHDHADVSDETHAPFPVQQDRAVRVCEPEVITNPNSAEYRELFGGIVFVPEAPYHVGEFLPVVEELERAGRRVSILLGPAPPMRELVVRELRRYDRRLFDWPEHPVELPEFDAMVVMNDWGPTKELMEISQARGVPGIAKVEGVQDFDDVDTGRLRRPYHVAAHVLCQGQNDLRLVKNASTHLVGSVRLEAAWLAPPANLSRRDTIVVNSNFSFNVLTEAREPWARSVMEACGQTGLPYLVSLHRADNGVYPEAVRAAEPLRYLFASTARIFVSRFSTALFEAMAAGIPVVYHNPHGELVPTFSRPEGAFPVTTSTRGLTSALRAALDLDAVRDQTEAFFRAQVDIDPRASAAARHAEAIMRLIEHHTARR